MKHETIKLSLLENSHAFLQEAVANAIQADSDPRRWQFAIVHLVQANELGLKAALERVHPVLVREKIDEPKGFTVNPRTAMQRLQDPQIGGLAFSKKDMDRVEEAIQLRNQVMHQNFELNPQNGAAKFFALLPFVLHFQETHLKTRIKKVLSLDARKGLLRIEKALKEMVKAALERIEREGVDPALVWGCPSCDQATFVVKEMTGTCYTCRHKERLVKCEHCGSNVLKKDLQHLIPWDYVRKSPGAIEALEAYGDPEYLDAKACPKCFDELQEDGGVQWAQDLAGSAWMNEECGDEDDVEDEEDEPDPQHRDQP